ncbi:hypothetical protein G7054_g11973 [Neopestalotiopsis clavispora]|nr:hypothetical protein G7054_g11973 [Neopestalotiopsis clavispora]
MSSKAPKGKRAAKGGAEDKREDVLQAVLIADTFQQRFQPFSQEKPRCLLPLANTPIIEYTLEFLAMNGVQEVFIYAGAHQEQIENYIRQSRWTPLSRACPFNLVDFVKVSDARSIGDFLRDLDNRGLIDGDFVLVHGDLVSNISLDNALAAHRARKEANRDSIMTLVLREGGQSEHHTKVNGITPIFAVDPSAKRCLHYEEMDPFQADHYLTLDPDLLKTKELDIRSDLIDAQIDICTPDVLAQWSESFDYELPRAHFLHGVLKDYELNGKMIHTEIVSEGYSARASNLQMFEAVSRDVLGGWAYPFSPDTNLVKGQTYQRWEDNVFRENDVHFGSDCKIRNSMFGRDTDVGSDSQVTNSFIGKNCRIGKNVQIKDSFLWDDVTVEDGAVIDHSVVAEFTQVGKQVQIGAGSLIASGVHISENVILPPATILSLTSAEGVSVPTDVELLGQKGKGARFHDPEFDELDNDDPYRLQMSLIYSLEGLDLDESDVSTLASEDEYDEDDDQSVAGGRDESRSRLSSFASDDSSGGGTAFVSEAVHGLLEVLRGESGGDFSSEKLEFMSLRLANNASDVAVRRAVATAFVRRAVELMNSESGQYNQEKAAKTVLTERDGAKEFILDVGVGGGSVEEQIEFSIALQKACVSISRIIEIPSAGTLCAAFFRYLYEEEIVEEDGILGWWADERSSEGDPMSGVRERCEQLVNWLEEAEEEDSDEEESDDE